MNIKKSIHIVKLISQFTKNVVIVGSKIIIDNTSFELVEYLRNHFTMDSILFEGKVMSIEEFVK